MEFENYRIRKYDSLNIVVEEFKTGEVVPFGKHKGAMGKDKWVIKSYHSKLPMALNALSEYVVGDNLETVESVQSALKSLQNWKIEQENK